MKALIGFDGFIDELYSVVQSREGPSHFNPFLQIADFGQALVRCAAVSGYFELVPKQRKLGGNGPIFAEALLNVGADVSFIGALGLPTIDPLFQNFAKKCRHVYSVAESGHTNALEFSDGKIMLSQCATLNVITPENLLKVVPKAQWSQLLEEVELFGSVNWTAIYGMNDLWKWLLKEIVPGLSKKRRFLFVDIANPQKREPSELQEAFQLLKEWQRTFDVVLGLNEAEGSIVAETLGISFSRDHLQKDPASLQLLREKLGIAQLLIHTKVVVFAADATGVYVQPVELISEPLVTTGVGDHFNAGYCYGLLSGYPVERCLKAARIYARHYAQYGDAAIDAAML